VLLTRCACDVLEAHCASCKGPPHMHAALLTTTSSVRAGHNTPKCNCTSHTQPCGLGPLSPPPPFFYHATVLLPIVKLLARRQLLQALPVACGRDRSPGVNCDAWTKTLASALALDLNTRRHFPLACLCFLPASYSSSDIHYLIIIYISSNLRICGRGGVQPAQARSDVLSRRI